MTKSVGSLKGFVKALRVFSPFPSPSPSSVLCVIYWDLAWVLTIYRPRWPTLHSVVYIDEAFSVLLKFSVSARSTAEYLCWYFCDDAIKKDLTVVWTHCRVLLSINSTGLWTINKFAYRVYTLFIKWYKTLAQIFRGSIDTLEDYPALCRIN